MDRRQFDWIARELSLGVTRRGVLGGIAALSGVAAGSIPVPGEAAQRKHCRAGKVRCGDKCVRGTCCPGTTCKSASSCKCYKAAAGDTFCVPKNSLVACNQCASDADCDPGFRCGRSDICNGLTALCLPVCV